MTEQEYNPSHMNFRTKYSLGKFNSSILKSHHFVEKRIKWAQDAKAQYPNKFPLIVERAQDRAANSPTNDLAEMGNPK